MTDRSVRSALTTLRTGRPVVVIGTTGECAVVLAAYEVRTEWVAWTVRYTCGLLCAPMLASRADQLVLPPMVLKNCDQSWPRYTVSVDASAGVTTGISAADRACTFRALAAPQTTPVDLHRPGHVLPMCTHPGGILQRLALPEAAVSLCILAKLPPVAVLATLTSDDGELLEPSDARQFALQHEVPTLRIGDLVGSSGRSRGRRGRRGKPHSAARDPVGARPPSSAVT